MKNTNEKLEAIFHRAKDFSDPGQREIYLTDACRNEPELRGKVDGLLDAALDADALFGGETIDAGMPLSAGPTTQVAEGPGSRIGRYKLLQQIGEGGMGVVFMAEQTEPVRRNVAFKIIKLGMDTKQVVARFEAERQALALMDHPNIAKVLDAGSTASGRPYFVMELVKGVPINEYCDKNQLSTKDRLHLFTQVCQAIQHAHQKGVIHRDIKPSNILVTLHDGKPVPKVIDFGIAKATNQRLTEKTLFTNFAQMIGTPAYMSPEQAEMSGLDVDTRTDVYSLGVLLYELLTGTTPFPEKALLSKGYGEMQRVIAEEQPDRPSLRLSTLLGEQQTIVAKNRAGDSSSISKQLRGDLDWIVMKALEKDRTRRYDTANGFAEDIHRHLNDEPVLAAKPTFGYQVKKLYHRNKPAFAAAAGIAIALAVGTGVATAEAIKADIHAMNEKELRIEAERLVEEAEREREKTQALVDFVFQEFIGLADPEKSTQRSLTLLEALEKIDEKITENFADRPELEIDAREALGNAYVFRFDTKRSSNHLKRAYELSRKVYGDSNLRTLQIGRKYIYAWFWSAFREGEFPEEELDTIARRLFDTATTLFEPDDPRHFLCHHIEAWRRTWQEDEPNEEIIQFLSQTLERHDEIKEIDPIAAGLTLYILGNNHFLTETSPVHIESQRFFRTARDEFIAYAGESFPLALMSRRAFANALSASGEHHRAIREYETILATGQDIFTNPAFLTQISTYLLKEYVYVGDDEKAEALKSQVMGDTASEYKVVPFLIERYYYNVQHLSHEEAKANDSWQRALEGLQSLLTMELTDIERHNVTEWIRRCYYHLGNLDAEYEAAKRIPQQHGGVFRVRGFNRIAVGDWKNAEADIQEALEKAPANKSVLVAASRIALHNKNRKEWEDLCHQLLPVYSNVRVHWGVRALMSLVGQPERLPKDLESQALEIAEEVYQTEGMTDASGRSESVRILSGGLAAWRQGDIATAIERLSEWPYETITPPLDRRFDWERYRDRHVSTQHLLLANCHARLGNLEEARKHRTLCDEALERISYDWWDSIVLAPLRNETDELIEGLEP